MVHPLVELVLPAVEVDEQQAPHVAPHRRHAHQPRLDQVHRLQLHVGGEPVAQVVLDEHAQTQTDRQTDRSVKGSGTRASRLARRWLRGACCETRCENDDSGM